MGTRRVEDESAKALAGAVTRRRLRDIAGARYFERGEEYFDDGAVLSLRADGAGIQAVVEGARRYRVRLRLQDGALDYDCSCPLGHEGAFCKHCVAAGLAWRAGEAEETEIEFGEEDLRAHLLGLAREELVSLLIEQAEEDDRLHRRLMLRAARAAPGDPDLSVWKDALDDALDTDDYFDYRGAYDYVAGVEDVIESLEEMLRAGQAESVIQLAEHGLGEVERSLEHVDDSDGWMGGMLDRLQELHLAACRSAPPDPVDLAERLFEAETDSSFDTFHRAAFVYADILGEAGLAAYRRMAEAEWAKIPALKPGEDDPHRDGRRFRITTVMEALAETSGDLAALVAVMSRDLSSPYAFLKIAELYHDAGDPDLALDWAERGWRAFEGGRRDGRLRDFIADAYQRRGRRDEAVALMWEAFVEEQRLDTYRELERHGRRAKQWPDWREKALALVRERIGNETVESPDRPVWMRAPSRDNSLLVEIFLHEGDPEAAWREAEAGGCSPGLWLRLAERRQATHPEDAIRIYKAHITALLGDTGERVYKEAVGFIAKIEALLVRSGQAAKFRPFLEEIRATHRRKRNLMKMLDQEGR